jgi:hypothetical protein
MHGFTTPPPPFLSSADFTRDFEGSSLPKLYQQQTNKQTRRFLDYRKDTLST